MSHSAMHLFPSRDIHNYHNIFLSRSFSANNFFDADGIGGGWEADSSAENYMNNVSGQMDSIKLRSALPYSQRMELQNIQLFPDTSNFYHIRLLPDKTKKDITVSRIHHPTIPTQ